MNRDKERQGCLGSHFLCRPIKEFVREMAFQYEREVSLKAEEENMWHTSCSISFSYLILTSHGIFSGICCFLILYHWIDDPSPTFLGNHVLQFHSSYWLKGYSYSHHEISPFSQFHLIAFTYHIHPSDCSWKSFPLLQFLIFFLSPSSCSLSTVSGQWKNMKLPVPPQTLSFPHITHTLLHGNSFMQIANSSIDHIRSVRMT